MISEENCDDFSERTAQAVHRQVHQIIMAAINREARARALAAPGEGIVPWDLYAGAATGAVGAIVDALWSVCDPGATKDGPNFPGLLATIAHEFVQNMDTPPGTFILEAERQMTKLRQRRRGMN